MASDQLTRWYVGKNGTGYLRPSDGAAIKYSAELGILI